MHLTSAPRSVVATLAGSALAVVVVVALVVLAMAQPAGAPRPAPPDRPSLAPRPPAGPPVSVVEAVEAVHVLHDWDRARARAWAAGDTAALGRLYAPRSDAGRHDVAMLRRWVVRGLRVRRMTMQVLAVALRYRSDRRLVLVVTDRLSSAEAVAIDGDTPRLLPRDGATTRRLEFRRTAHRWLLSSVYARPLATTASTSTSRN